MTETLRKICKLCGEDKPLDDFAKLRDSRDGRRNWCRVCAAERLRQWREKNWDHVRAYRKEYGQRPERKAKHRERCRAAYHRNKDYTRNKNLIREFGITLADYNELLAAQDGRCAICQKPCKSGRQLAVDHCHETGAVRALLCMNCNRALGWMGENPDLLMAAAAYVINHRDRIIGTA